MRRDLIACALARLAFTVVFGLAYPLATTGVAQVLFPGKADGSRVERGGRLVGSRLIGQDFKNKAAYFQSRPSATGYNPFGTFFGNLGPNQKDLRAQLRKNLAAYLKRERPADPGLRAKDLPGDAVTNSGSGVDPHISVANARIQAHRVARARNLPLGRVDQLID